MYIDGVTIGKCATTSGRKKLEMAKLITVFGATGNQGGGVVRALVSQPAEFKVRGVSRNIAGERALELTQLGVEMVEASYDDVASLERAMEGTHGVFAVTNFFEVLDPVREEQQGKNIVDAAKESGVEHLVFSGCPSALDLCGKSVSFMEGRANAEKYMFESGVPSTSVWYGFYFENILTMSKPRKVGPNEFIWDIPMEGKPLRTVDMATAGAAVAAIFKSQKEYIGRAVGLASESKPVSEYCSAVTKYIAPRKLTASAITAEEYGKQGFPGAKDMANFCEIEQKGLINLDPSEIRRMTSEVLNFEDYVRNNKDNFQKMFDDLK